MRWLIFFCFLQVISLFLRAQEKEVQWLLGASLAESVVWGHDKTLSQFGGSRAKGFQLDIQRKRVDAEASSYAGISYSSGFSFQVFQFDSAALGTTVNALYFIEPVIAQIGKSSLRLRAAGGFNYATNPFNRQSNRTNTAYSLHTSGCLTMGLTFDFPVRGGNLIAYSGMNHFSNGNSKNPNYGLNYFQFSVGYEGNLGRPVKSAIQSYQNGYRGYYAEIYGQYANKTHQDAQGKRWSVLGGTFLVGRRLSNLHAVYLGGEWFSDPSLRFAMDNHPIYGTGNFSHRLAGVFIGHDFVFHRMRFSTALGTYVFKEAPNFFTGPFYQRWGVDFTFFKKVVAGINLNTNFQKAFVLDVRLGYRVDFQKLAKAKQSR
ncbi:MAG: hypothetical protein LCH37_09975 [Bacteroidetes bacterium]|nr:hypothetical protein [Bacteroidota bacterium]MCK6610910.1 hypothetical protein [Bacteroidia bacterium]